MRLQGGQLGFLRVDLFRQCAAQRGICQRCPLPPVRCDQIHDRFGLRQAQLAVQKGAAGVLAGGGRLRTRCKTGFHQPPRHRAAAVAGKLHHVLAGVAVGRAEKQSNALVKGFFPVHEMPEQCGVAPSFFHLFCRVCRVEHPGSHSVAFCAGQAHHGNAARPGGRCDGGNGRSLHTASFPRTRLAGALFVRPVRQSRRSAHSLILQLILPRFCAKRYTRRAVFPHLPKCLWKKGSKMASAYRVAAPSIRIVPWAALASCWPLPQQLLPVSATGGGRRRCTLAMFSGKIILYFAILENLRIFQNCLFTGGVVEGNGICSAAFCESAALRESTAGLRPHPALRATFPRPGEGFSGSGTVSG